MSALAPPAEFVRKVTIWSRLRLVLYVVFAATALYVASIGPMSPILCHHCGEKGHRIWQAVYGEPLAHLPRPCRNAVNWYLSVSEKVYWRMYGR